MYSTQSVTGVCTGLYTARGKTPRTGVALRRDRSVERKNWKQGNNKQTRGRWPSRGRDRTPKSPYKPNIRDRAAGGSVNQGPGTLTSEGRASQRAPAGRGDKLPSVQRSMWSTLGHLEPRPGIVRPSWWGTTTWFAQHCVVVTRPPCTISALSLSRGPTTSKRGRRL